MCPPHLLEQEHDVDPERRLLAHQGEAGFAVQAVVALQGTAEEQLCHTAPNSVCKEIHGMFKSATNQRENSVPVTGGARATWANIPTLGVWDTPAGQQGTDVSAPLKKERNSVFSASDLPQQPFTAKCMRGSTAQPGCSLSLCFLVCLGYQTIRSIKTVRPLSLFKGFVGKPLPSQAAATRG